MKLKIDVFVKLAPPLGNSDTLESITMPSDDLGLFSSSKFRIFICAYGSFSFLAVGQSKQHVCSLRKWNNTVLTF
jgi:hypothetical protein